MKTSQFVKNIPGEFVYHYVNSDGEDAQEPIKYTVKQTSFRESFAIAKDAENVKSDESFILDLSNRITSWDIENDLDANGGFLPHDFDTLMDLPDAFLIQLMNSIAELYKRVNPTMEPPKNSENGSEQTEKLASQTKKR